MYSGVMHIKDQENNRFISEEEYNSIISELEYGRSQEELNKQKEEDNIYHNYILNHKTPEQIIRNNLNSHNEKLKALFEGTAVQAYDTEDTLSEEKLYKMAESLNLQTPDRFYVPFNDDEGKLFMIESLRGQPADIRAIAIFLMKHLQDQHTEVK